MWNVYFNLQIYYTCFSNYFIQNGFILVGNLGIQNINHWFKLIIKILVIVTYEIHKLVQNEFKIKSFWNQE